MALNERNISRSHLPDPRSDFTWKIWNLSEGLRDRQTYVYVATDELSSALKKENDREVDSQKNRNISYSSGDTQTEQDLPDKGHVE